MKSIYEILLKLSELSSVSGREISENEHKQLSSLFPTAEIDALGNVLFFKKGTGKNPKKVLIEAHRDEIGLCVKDILEGGFLSVVECGGIDAKILPGTEFTVCGTKNVSCIATSTPPHLSGGKDKNEKFNVEQVYLDTGMLSKKKLKGMVSIGDPIMFAAEPVKLSDGKISGRGFDNKASVAAGLLAFEKVVNCENDVYLLLSVGEETTSRGVRKICRDIDLDAAFVVDVGFAFREGLDRTSCILMDHGPSVSYTDTLSRKMSNWACYVAKREGIPFQVIAEPGGTGTSATAIQLENGGIPSVVISIPLLNMHTPGEIVSENDIKNTANLLLAIVHDCEIPQKEVILFD